MHDLLAADGGSLTIYPRFAPEIVSVPPPFFLLTLLHVCTKPLPRRQVHDMLPTEVAHAPSFCA